MSNYVLLAMKNLRSNLGRSMLTAMSVIVLVFAVTMIWSVLTFLDKATTQQSKSFKGIVTERWSLPSQMPYTYARRLSEGAARPNTDDIQPIDSMAWQFYAGSTDPQNRTPGSSVFAVATDPSKLLTMMDELDNLQGFEKESFEKSVGKLQQNKQGIILGQQRLKSLKKQVGDRIKLYGFAFYKDLQMEFEIVGVFPPGRYDSSATIHQEYYNRVIDAYPKANNGRRHPLAEKSLNIVWMKMPDATALGKIEQQIRNSGWFAQPSVKVETASAGVALLLTAYKDLLTIMRWVLVPAILMTLAVVVSNAISISVRERRKEIAVMKILGFRPIQILGLVLGEAVLLGGIAGAVSSIGTYLFVNRVLNGIAFPIAFFTKFYIDPNAIWWGVLIGIATAMAGSLVPAWSASSTKIADVFSRVG